MTSQTIKKSAKNKISSETMMSKDTGTGAGTVTSAVITDDCAICCFPYNRSTHLPIICEYVNCNNKVCIECTRTYLMSSTTEAHCMECKQPWSSKFMLILKKNWLEETYKIHRKKLLLDIELSKIPEAMEAAEISKKVQNEKKYTVDLRKKALLIKEQLNEINHLIYSSDDRIRKITNKKETEKKVFFMSCPSPQCNGMLSTQYKCGICALYTCPTCHDLIGDKKHNEEHPEQEHVCNPDSIASAEAIKKETRQCPGCHNRIYKTDGCSQMWCTGCHTAFDWNTGRKVISERLHNPHWLEYQRSINNGQVPRAPGDVPCGGLVSMTDCRRWYAELLMQNEELLVNKIKNIYNLVQDMTNNYVRVAREDIQRMRDYKGTRVSYILGDITKEEMATLIFKNDRIRQKKTELLNVYELLSAVGIDLFRRLIQSNKKNKELIIDTVDQITQYDALRNHCNVLFATISNTYNQSVPHICDDWKITSKKFTSRSIMLLSKSTEQNENVVLGHVPEPALVPVPEPALVPQTL